jgi:TldD protein
MHEAVGHRLEGSRLLSAGEGQTFRDSVGTQILPPFLSMRDNPRLERHGGRSLVGHYRYDDEGVEARDTLLVERGVLQGFLTSRCGIASRHRSTGHARAAYYQRPIARMGVTIVESHGGLDEAGLRERFLEEIRSQGAPYGIRVIEASSGETATEAYNFQAFLGEVSLASRVYPDGREEWIRGVDFVGTPLNAIRGIVAAGKRLCVDNAFCGAESGYVPVSTISPALVLSELELQSKAETPFSPYTFPIPWNRKR